MGFPSPASDYIERRLDLNDILMPHCNNMVLIETPNGCVLADKSLRLVPGRSFIPARRIFSAGQTVQDGDNHPRR